MVEKNEKLIAVSENTVLEVLNYLVTRPYSESANLIHNLQKGKVIEYKDEPTDGVKS